MRQGVRLKRELPRMLRAAALAAALTGCEGEQHVLGDGRPDGGGSGAECGDGEAVPEGIASSSPRAIGFGRAVTGGAHGCLRRVTTLEDSGAGSLREALEAEGAAYVVFDVSGEIVLDSDVELASDKTVDGRGSQVTIRDHGFRIDGESNVIVENVAFAGDSSLTGDAIQISNGAHTIFIDHCSLSSYGDGLIDVSLAATDVTVSHCHFFDHDKVMLLGANPEDTMDVAIRVTLHHNWFEATGTYHPRLRFGWAHSYNNLVERWQSWGSGSSQGGELYSEANVFVAESDDQATLVEIAEDPEPGRLRSVGDLAMNGAVIVQREPELVRDPASAYAYTVEVADETLITRLRQEVGPR